MKSSGFVHNLWSDSFNRKALKVIKFAANCQFSRPISCMLAQTMKLLASIREFSGSNLGRVTNHPKLSAIFLSPTRKISAQHFKIDHEHFNVLPNSLFAVHSCSYSTVFFFFAVAWQPLVDQGLLIVEATKSHPGTPHSVGLHWTSDHPDTETTWQRNNHKTPMPPGGIRTRNPSKRTAEEPRLSPSGHWARHSTAHVT